MNCYRFVQNDQRHNNWLLFTESTEPPYVTIRPDSTRFVCGRCKAIDHDSAFKNGFPSGLKIRARSNVFMTSEGFFCFDDQVRQIAVDSGFEGIAFQKLIGTRWNAINVTCRVQADPTAYEYSKNVCPQCQRPIGVGGLIRFLSQITVPDRTGTFFAPTFDRCGSMNGDRDLFVTENIVLRFKEQRVKGGMFERLLTKEEEARFRAVVAANQVFRWPKGARLFL